MIFAVMGSERWMKMEELNGYTPPASLNLSDFQDAIGDAVVQAIIKIGIRVNREELLKALKYDRFVSGEKRPCPPGKDCTERRKKTKNRRRNLIL